MQFSVATLSKDQLLTLLSQFAHRRLFDVHGKIYNPKNGLTALPPLPLLVTHILPEFEVWMRVLCRDFLYCPYDQGFQWKLRNRGKVNSFMKSTPFDFCRPTGQYTVLAKKVAHKMMFVT